MFANKLGITRDHEFNIPISLIFFNPYPTLFSKTPLGFLVSSRYPAIKCYHIPSTVRPSNYLIAIFDFNVAREWCVMNMFACYVCDV